MARVCRVARETCCAAGMFQAARVCRIAVLERHVAQRFRAARAALAVRWSGCAARELPFVYYWLVAERAWYGAARSLPLERLRQAARQVRCGASQAFLMGLLMARESGARQQPAQRLLSRS